MIFGRGQGREGNREPACCQIKVLMVSILMIDPTQPKQVGDHQVAPAQAEKHQVPEVQQRAQQNEPR